ncbi:hypothetical protein D779_0232 [Imhoffiella purpurea]|uniref:Uncharacterized protein n=1 Tax=Imhoffiella purpurea TaxID=1249627 RepID=W9V289_9GAMM|nr:hypothetical protein D779_0232 [Imhoffiella purpurea]
MTDVIARRKASPRRPFPARTDSGSSNIRDPAARKVASRGIPHRRE